MSNMMKINTARLIESLSGEQLAELRDTLQENRYHAVKMILQESPVPCEFPIAEMAEFFALPKQRDATKSELLFEDYKKCITTFSQIVEPIPTTLQDYALPKDIYNNITYVCNIINSIALNGLKDARNEQMEYKTIDDRVRAAIKKINETIIEIKKLVNQKQQHTPVRQVVEGMKKSINVVKSFITNNGIAIYVIGFIIYEGYTVASSIGSDNWIDAIKKYVFYYV